MEITFKSTPNGTFCEGCPEPIETLKLGEDFQFRIWAFDESGTELEMKGATYSIPLPLSKVSSPNLKVQTFTVHPFFSQKHGKIINIVLHYKTNTFALTISGSILMSKIASKFEYIGNDRTTWTYLPPSYTENPKPTYDVIYMFDFGQTAMVDFFLPSLDKVFTSDLCQDAIIIGFGDYKTKNDRFDMLTQVRFLPLTPVQIALT